MSETTEGGNVSATEAPPIDKLAMVYRKITAKIQEITQTRDNEIEQLEAQRNMVKDKIKAMMLELKVSSVKTDQGTVVLATKTRYNTQDWDAFKQFVLEHEAVDLLEKRIAQSNMSQFLNENPGVVPPGLNSTTEYTISVRKPQQTN